MLWILGFDYYENILYSFSSKVPRYIRILAPKGALEIHERAWNAFPYCRTIVSVSRTERVEINHFFHSSLFFSEGLVGTFFTMFIRINIAENLAPFFMCYNSFLTS